MMTFASFSNGRADYDGPTVVLSEDSPKRLATYWDKLERALSAYLRERGEFSGESTSRSVDTAHAAQPEAADYRSDRRHNGRMIAAGDRSLDPAQWADSVSDLRNMLSEVDGETAIVADYEWELNRLSHKWKDQQSAPLRLPVRAPDVRSFCCGIADPLPMPDPILSPEYVACPELADQLRAACGIETQRDIALRFIASQSEIMLDSLAAQEPQPETETIDPYALFAMADQCTSILQAAGLASRAFYLLARCGS